MNESLDTNAILRYIIADVPPQFNKVQALLARPGIVYHVADLVFVEIAQVLKYDYDYDDAAIAEVMQVVLDMPQFRCNEAMLRPAIELFLAHPKLSFADCCLEMYAELNDAEPFWTFDQKLASQTRAAKLIA